MVTVEREIKASAEAIWNVLADGWLYAAWVVGASRMRAVDPRWPATGAVLHRLVQTPADLESANPNLLHGAVNGGTAQLFQQLVFRPVTGLGRAETVVKASVPQRELVLHGKARPLGEVAIRVQLEPRPSGCLVILQEDAVGGPMALIPPLVRQLMIRPRNTEALRRLAYLAEGESR